MNRQTSENAMNHQAKSMGLWRFAKMFAQPLWGWYLVGVIALCLTNLIALEIPLLIKEITNAFENATKYSTYLRHAVMIIALGILTIIVRALSRVFIFYAGRRLEADSKNYFFYRLIHLPQVFYDRFGMGELISRLANDIAHLRAFFAFALLQFMNMVFLVVFTVNKMLSINPMLTVVALAPILLSVLIVKVMMGYLHRISLENQEAIGRLTNKATESFVNVHVIKTNSVEKAFSERIRVENEDVFRTNIKSVLIRTGAFPLMGLLMNISQVAVLFYGGKLVMQDQLTVGDLIAFNVFIAYLSFPLTAIGIIISLWQRSQIAVGRIGKISAEPTEDSYQLAAQKISSDNLVEIRNLNFAYPVNQAYMSDIQSKDSIKRKVEAKPSQTILKNMNLNLKQGERLGIYGAVGSGKSTLFQVLFRIYNPDAGQIFFKGQDILSFPIQEIRQQIGYAEQVPRLFSASVLENLRMGMPEKSQEEVIHAAKKAQILGEIQRFPDGWDTEIGERGIKLSGGQKQRLALARIFLRDANLLLLDDIFSAVDYETENQLINTLLDSDVAMMIASHRPSVLKKCDRVIILDSGEIVAEGTYEELLSKGYFTQLDEAQNDA